MNRELFTVRTKHLVHAAFLVLVLVPWESMSLPALPVLAPSKAELAAYIYESEDNSIPPEVSAAMADIRKLGIETRMLDDDVQTGADEPVLVSVIEAAREHGLPAFVVVRGGKATAMDVPKEGQFVEAVK